MPCDTIQTVKVSEELKNIDIKLLKKALEAMGFTVSMSKTGETLSFAGTNESTGRYHSGTYTKGKFTQITKGFSPKLDLNSVKVAYSHQVVQKSAMDFGWKLTKTGGNNYIAQK